MLSKGLKCPINSAASFNPCVGISKVLQSDPSSITTRPACTRRTTTTRNYASKTDRNTLPFSLKYILKLNLICNAFLLELECGSQYGSDLGGEIGWRWAATFLWILSGYSLKWFLTSFADGSLFLQAGLSSWILNLNIEQEQQKSL